jgi:hypothetical protein
MHATVPIDNAELIWPHIDAFLHIAREGALTENRRTIASKSERRNEPQMESNGIAGRRN